MLSTKTKPIGIDVSIQALQSRIYQALKTKWGLTDDQYNCYGRCYKNRKEDGFVAELFESGKDYKDAYWDDTLSAVSFFGEGERSESVAAGMSTDVHLVFFVNLAKIKPTTQGRADAEARGDVICHMAANLLSVEIGLDNVLREYPGSRKALYQKVEMQPVHCFRLNIKMIYDPKACIGPGLNH